MVMSKIIQGDALTELSKLQSESVDCCITSPPYWALRDYKVSGQLGLEPTFQEYITKLVTIFDEVKRVLKKSGTCWVVIGDTYNTGATGSKTPWNNKFIDNKTGKILGDTPGLRARFEASKNRKKITDIPDKCLTMIPERFAIAMVDHGWILRNKIIWYKPNCMPSSAKDRFTVDFECVYFFTKSQKYFFETQYEPLQDTGTGWSKQQAEDKWHVKSDMWKFGTEKRHQFRYGNKSADGRQYNQNPLGRIKRCVWKISTKPFSAQKLLADYVGADGKLYRASPDCPIHGHLASQRESDIQSYDERLNSSGQLNDNLDTQSDPVSGGKSDKCVCSSKIPDHFAVFPPDLVLPMIKAGCPSNGIVLDPFFGAGTVGLVALQNGRDFIGIELNPDYIKIAEKRLEPWLNQQKLR